MLLSDEEIKTGIVLCEKAMTRTHGRLFDDLEFHQSLSAILPQALSDLMEAKKTIKDLEKHIERLEMAYMTSRNFLNKGTL